MAVNETHIQPRIETDKKTEKILCSGESRLSAASQYKFSRESSTRRVELLWVRSWDRDVFPGLANRNCVGLWPFGSRFSLGSRPWRRTKCRPQTQIAFKTETHRRGRRRNLPNRWSGPRQHARQLESHWSDSSLHPCCRKLGCLRRQQSCW